jgi:hypothetical protein
MWFGMLMSGGAEGFGETVDVFNDEGDNVALKTSGLSVIKDFTALVSIDSENALFVGNLFAPNSCKAVEVVHSPGPSRPNLLIICERYVLTLDEAG